MTGARSSTGAANGRGPVRTDLGVVIEVFAFCDREGAPAVSVRACDVFGAPLGDERADHVSAVLVAAGNAIGARRARDGAARSCGDVGEVFSRRCPACGWWARRSVDDGSCRVCDVALVDDVAHVDPALVDGDGAVDGGES
jgi:hypothetical protein